MELRPVSIFLCISLITISHVLATTCSTDSPCSEGCCSSISYVCGYGPDYCGDSCIAAASTNGSCSQLAECDPGVYPGWGTVWGSEYVSADTCPLDVCCSEFGFCGTTSDFCGDTSWPEPSCSGQSSTARAVGYYEGWNLNTYSCLQMTPEEIPIGAYTHLNFAFLYIDPDTFEITPMESDQVSLYSRFTALKDYSSSLETWISIGGWDMNSPGSTQTTFSDLAASTTAQNTFISSLKSFLTEYNFDGVDIDWEYPGASERGGNSADYDNFVTLLQNIRSGLGDDYGLSITLPNSYWYMQYFDIVNISKTIDWFNVMTYDIYGTWDSTVSDIGAYVYADTNLTMIREGLELLWHNGIDPSMVNIGYGFYGRSYTLSEASCLTTGCPFSAGGNAGPCTNTEGMLSYSEIYEIITDPSRAASVTLDSEAAVKIAVFDDNQWVGYDDEDTLLLKQEFANSLCIGGSLTWAVDLDNTGALSGGISNVTDLYPETNDTSVGGEIYIGPSIWTNDTQDVACNPPCTFILPPRMLPSSSVVTWPALTTSVVMSSAGEIYSRETVISVDPFTITDISFWPVTVVEKNSVSAIIVPEQSIMPPAITLILPGTEGLFPVTQTPSTTSAIATQTDTSTASISTPAAVQTGIASDCTAFYKAVSGDSCYSIAEEYNISLDDFYSWNPAVGDDCGGLWLDEYYCVAISSSTIASGTISLAVTPTFYSTSHSVVIQPQPTVSQIFPPSLIPPLSYFTGTPPSSGGCSSSSSISGCGSLDCALFGCNGECGIFGCDGGCGIGFCGGGCGLEGCGPGCGSGSCDNPGGGGGEGSEPEDETCTTTNTASVCTLYVSSSSVSSATSWTTTTATVCFTTTGCSVQASTTTATISATGAACALPTIASNFPFAFGTDGPILTSITLSLSESIVITTGATTTTAPTTAVSGSSDAASSTTSTAPTTSASSNSLAYVYQYSDSDCSGDNEVSTHNSATCIAYEAETYGIEAIFDNSVYSVTVYDGEYCEAANVIEELASEKCYAISSAGPWGSFGIALV